MATQTRFLGDWGEADNFVQELRMPRPNTSPARNSGLPEFTPKIPRKYRKKTKNVHFWYFFGIFGVFSWGSRISARGVLFRYFPWKFRVGPSRGSVAGRGVLNPRKQVWRILGQLLQISRRILRRMFPANFLPLILQGFRTPPKFTPQNCWHSSNPRLLKKSTGETKICCCHCAGPQKPQSG